MFEAVNAILHTDSSTVKESNTDSSADAGHCYDVPARYVMMVAQIVNICDIVAAQFANM